MGKKYETKQGGSAGDTVTLQWSGALKLFFTTEIRTQSPFRESWRRKINIWLFLSGVMCKGKGRGQRAEVECETMSLPTSA